MVLNMTENEVTFAIIQSLKDANKSRFGGVIEQLQPYDMAQQYLRIPAKHRNKFVLFLSIDQMKGLIGELKEEDQLEFLQKLGGERSSKVLDLMENDDLAELLSRMDSEHIEELLSGMNKEELQVVKNMMDYPAETAGRIMNNRYVWIPQNYTVREAVDKLKDFAELAEYLNYLYVIDEEKKLLGVVSYKDLILADIQDKIENIMFTRLVKTDVHTDQEEVAKLISRYDFVSLPVVEEDDKLVGIVTVVKQLI